MLLYLYYGQLVCFTAALYIIWPFGRFIPVFGLLYQEKFGNPGANPTIVSYNASAVKNYNTTSNLVHFENKTLEPILQFLNLQLQRQRNSRLEHF
jgi:hypothetical protein